MGNTVAVVFLVSVYPFMNLVLVPSVEKLAFGPIHILPSVET
jgi:hypothetical protein